MALLPEKQIDQIKLIVAVVAIAAAGVYYQYVWSPTHDKLSATEAKVNAIDSLNRLAKQEVSRGSVALVKRQADQYGRDLELLRRLVPTGNEIPVLLDEISTASRRAGLDLAEFTPEGVTTGDEFDTFKYKLKVSGSYSEIGDFLTNIGSLQRIVAPINVQLLPSQRTDLKLKKGERLLDAQFEIQTYVAHGGSPAKRTSAAGAVGGAP